MHAMRLVLALLLFLLPATADAQVRPEYAQLRTLLARVDSILTVLAAAPSGTVIVTDTVVVTNTVVVHDTVVVTVTDTLFIRDSVPPPPDTVVSPPPPPPDTTPPPPTGAGVNAPPVGRGMWVSKAELDGIPASGALWNEVLSAANATWSASGVCNDAGGTWVRDVQAGALVFARLKPASGGTHVQADGLRAKVAAAIRSLIALSLGSCTDTRPGRHIGGWPIVADLINLRGYDPALDTAFRAWLNTALDHVWSNGQSMRTLRGEHMHNRGAQARFSSAAGELYLGGPSALVGMAQLMRRWAGDTSIRSVAGERTPFAEPGGGGDSWQTTQPVSQGTRIGVGPRGATRNGNNFDGVDLGDIYRGAPSSYDAGNYPPAANSTSYSYAEVTLYAQLGALLILHRAGYTDLVGAQDAAHLRALQWLVWAETNHPAKGWKYFGGSSGNAQEAAKPLAAYLYPGAGLPVGRGRTQRSGANYGYAWTAWLFGGRSR